MSQTLLEFQGQSWEGPSRYLSSFPKCNTQKEMLTGFMGHVIDKPKVLVSYVNTLKTLMALKALY